MVPLGFSVMQLLTPADGGCRIVRLLWRVFEVFSGVILS